MLALGLVISFVQNIVICSCDKTFFIEMTSGQVKKVDLGTLKISVGAKMAPEICQVAPKGANISSGRSLVAFSKNTNSCRNAK